MNADFNKFKKNYPQISLMNADFNNAKQYTIRRFRR
jgi:hypothetical protein